MRVQPDIIQHRVLYDGIQALNYSGSKEKSVMSRTRNWCEQNDAILIPKENKHTQKNCLKTILSRQPQ